ncbi:hypothetical protein PR048_007444 [Dryococelus australis]|uniref:Uncharacterized protein n=1 Tax=Dryococelus australis TaxID=614101 RepID=A0ABQ9HUJ5_9NEOP|nr:hypothetical protein PR048_007444 [Dryococelus australis]
MSGNGTVWRAGRCAVGHSAMTSEGHLHQSAHPCPKRQVGMARALSVTAPTCAPLRHVWQRHCVGGRQTGWDGAGAECNSPYLCSPETCLAKALCGGQAGVRSDMVPLRQRVTCTNQHILVLRDRCAVGHGAITSEGHVHQSAHPCPKRQAGMARALSVTAPTCAPLRHVWQRHCVEGRQTGWDGAGAECNSPYLCSPETCLATALCGGQADMSGYGTVWGAGRCAVGHSASVAANTDTATKPVCARHQSCMVLPVSRELPASLSLSVRLAPASSPTSATAHHFSLKARLQSRRIALNAKRHHNKTDMSTIDVNTSVDGRLNVDRFQLTDKRTTDGCDGIFVSPAIGVVRFRGNISRQRRGKQEIPEKTRRTVTSSGTVPICESPGVARPGIEPVSAWWEASRLTAHPPRPPTGSDYSILQGRLGSGASLCTVPLTSIIHMQRVGFTIVDAITEVVFQVVSRQDVLQNTLVHMHIRGWMILNVTYLMCLPANQGRPVSESSNQESESELHSYEIQLVVKSFREIRLSVVIDRASTGEDVFLFDRANRNKYSVTSETLHALRVGAMGRDLKNSRIHLRTN